MAFQVKSFVSIVASMVNRIRSTSLLLTDFNVGGVGRTLIEAPAQELDECYQQMLAAIVAAIPVATYKSFNFPALAAFAANGSIRVTITAGASAITIPSGVVFSPPSGSITYAATAASVIAAGGTFVDVPVAAATAGVAGNLRPGVAFTIGTEPAGFVSAINLTAIMNGADQETDAQHQARFAEYVLNLARSPVLGIKRGLGTANLTDANGNITEAVKFAAVIEPYVLDNTQSPSLINGYVHNGVGNTSPALVARALQIITGYTDSKGAKMPGYKAAGTVFTCAAATEVQVPVTAVVSVSPGTVEADAVAAVTKAIATYTLGLDLGASWVKAEAYAVAMAVPGVVNFVPSAPAADVVAGASVKLMPGALAITGA